jgi:hypothetical protein
VTSPPPALLFPYNIEPPRASIKVLAIKIPKPRCDPLFARENRAGSGGPKFPNGVAEGFSVSGVVTATSFRGDGSQLSGVDASTLKNGNDVKVQATSTGATVTGTLVSGNITSYGANTLGSLTVSNDATVQGNLTVNGTTTTIDTAVTAVDSLEIDGSVGIGTTVGTSIYGTNPKLTIDTTNITGDGPVYINSNKATQQGAVITIRAEGATNSDVNVFHGIKFGSASRTDYVIGKASRSGTGYLELRKTNTNNALLQIDTTGHILPGADNTQDLGSSSKRFANLYTGDLNLSNEGSTNDVDGTWGSYVIQEGEDDLFLINRRTGKKYKFNLTEV